MSYIVVSAMVIGAGVQIYGQMSAARSQAEAQEREAALKGMQAQELLQRQFINEQLMKDKSQFAEKFAGHYTGLEGYGGRVSGIMRLRKDLEQNLMTSRREAEWKAKMLRLGGEADLKLSSDIQAAGDISAISTGIQLGGRAAYSYSNAKAPSPDVKDLPGVTK